MATIIYLGNFILPDKNAAANRVWSNAKALRALGYRVVFLSVNETDSFDGLRSIDLLADCYEEPKPLTTKQWAQRLVSTESAEKLCEKYGDVESIILYNMPFITVKAFKHKFKDIKLFYDCTEWTKYTDGSLPKKVFKFCDEFFIKNMLAKTADGIIAVSKLMFNKYQHKVKTILVPPLVDLQDDIWHQEKISYDGYTYCFIGNLDGNKDSLNEVVKHFVNEQGKLRLIVAGISKSEYENHYNEQVNSDNVLFLGNLNHFDAVKQLLSSDCCIFFRKSDLRNNAGFPTKFVEAYTAGVDIITTQVSNLADYSGDRVSFVEMNSSSSVTSALGKNKEKTTKELDNSFDYHNYVSRFKTLLNG